MLDLRLNAPAVTIYEMCEFCECGYGKTTQYEHLHAA